MVDKFQIVQYAGITVMFPAALVIAAWLWVGASKKIACLWLGVLVCAYLIVGASKIARAVDILARRPQLQERLTGQIADAIMDGLSPDGVAVVIEAEHLCMTMRGVQKPGTTLVTSAIRGGFRRRAVTRAEFLSLVRGG